MLLENCLDFLAAHIYIALNRSKSLQHFSGTPQNEICLSSSVCVPLSYCLCEPFRIIKGKLYFRCSFSALRQQRPIPSKVWHFVLPFLCCQLPAAGRLIGLILAAIGSCVWATMRFARKSSKRGADHARPRA